MEKSGRIIFYCDSVTLNWIPELSQKINSHFPPKDGYALEISTIDDINTFEDAASRLSGSDLKGVAAIVLLTGWNDCVVHRRKYSDIVRYADRIRSLAGSNNIRIILSTLPPARKYASLIRKYNHDLLEYAVRTQTRVADLYQYLQKAGMTSYAYSRDPVVQKTVAEAVFPVLTRTSLLVLWQFNGRYAHCNYSCPYCYVATSVNKGIHFQYDMDTWEKAFDKHFHDKEVIFYFSYGEPMMAGNIFYDALEMIGRHPSWSVRMTSNVSLPLDRLLATRLAAEGRLNINASFHPTQISLSDFIKKCDEIRSHGIEPSVIYVMYPDQIDALEEYMPVFRAKGYVVHIRAFRGLYKGRKYPQAYSHREWKKTAKYMDRGNFKYQLHAVNGLGRMSMLGMSHILIDNYGKIEMCDSYVGDRHYGNIFDNRIFLDVKPYPFPGLVPLAAVDDIADYTELEYRELEGNNVNCYNEQGGVIKDADGTIHYPYENVDLDNKALITKLRKVPAPFQPSWQFWTNPKWLVQHFIYSFLIKKYGKYIWAWWKGKWSLLKKGKLRAKNFWHS